MEANQPKATFLNAKSEIHVLLVTDSNIESVPSNRRITMQQSERSPWDSPLYQAVLRLFEEQQGGSMVTDDRKTDYFIGPVASLAAICVSSFIAYSISRR